jgi:very-short-patch-repair endonuclease
MIHEKDERINNELRTDGYEIIRIWQSEFKKDPEKCLQKIIKIIKESKPTAL